MRNKYLFIFTLFLLVPVSIYSGSCVSVKPEVKPPGMVPSAPAANAPSSASEPAIQAWVMPNVITPGGSSRLSWDVINVTSVVIDQGIGSVPLSGSRQVSPDVSTTYTITAYSTAGTVSKSMTLTVEQAGTPSPAAPSQGTQGDNSFVGSTYTMEYHYAGCSIGRRITPPHRAWFSTWQDALSAGYHPCPVCKPPQSL